MTIINILGGIIYLIPYNHQPTGVYKPINQLKTWGALENGHF